MKRGTPLGPAGEFGSGLDVRPVEPGDWEDVTSLFGSRGACGGCWCMYWLSCNEGMWRQNKGEANQRSLEAAVRSGECHAIIARAGNTVSGWCRFGPRQDFPRLQRSRKLQRNGMADWAIVCLFVARKFRRMGIATSLAAAAAEAAFRAGGRAIEAYPVVPKEKAVPDVFAWTGVPLIFERAGFAAAGHDAGARRIYEKRNPVQKTYPRSSSAEYRP